LRGRGGTGTIKGYGRSTARIMDWEAELGSYQLPIVWTLQMTSGPHGSDLLWSLRSDNQEPFTEAAITPMKQKSSFAIRQNCNLPLSFASFELRESDASRYGPRLTVAFLGALFTSKAAVS